MSLVNNDWQEFYKKLFRDSSVEDDVGFDGTLEFQIHGEVFIKPLLLLLIQHITVRVLFFHVTKSVGVFKNLSYCLLITWNCIHIVSMLLK